MLTQSDKGYIRLQDTKATKALIWLILTRVLRYESSSEVSFPTPTSTYSAEKLLAIQRGSDPT